MVNDYNSLSGLQKVAVLFSVVGEGLSLSLVKWHSKTEIRKLDQRFRQWGLFLSMLKKELWKNFTLVS